MKTLYFEGAGCVPGGGDSDIENCRIRTVFHNDKGEKMYLELSDWVVSKGYDHKKLKRWLEYPDGYCIGFITDLFKITDNEDADDENCSRVSLDKTIIHYTKKEPLDFINKNLDCSFDEIKILNELTGYSVFNEKYSCKKDKYNFGDEFVFDEEKYQKRIAKRDELTAYFKKFMEYDNSSYWVEKETGNLVVRINTYDRILQKMKFKERQFVVEV